MLGLFGDVLFLFSREMWKAAMAHFDAFRPTCFIVGSFLVNHLSRNFLWYAEVFSAGISVM